MLKLQTNDSLNKYSNAESVMCSAGNCSEVNVGKSSKQ